jgi:hypothetical protein
VTAALALLTPAFAQNPLPERSDGTTLYLVVRTKPSVPDKRIVDTIVGGLEASSHTIDGRPVIKPVSPLFFEQFAELIGSPRPKAVDADAPAGKVGIRPLPSRDGALLELKLTNPKQTLTLLKVEYQSDGKPVAEEYMPTQPGDGPLTLIEPGRYAFRPTPNRTPGKYTATYDERDDRTKELTKGKTVAGDWPAQDKFYVVTLNNFRRVPAGRHNHEVFLREIERQNLNTANPITITRLGGDQLFVFADMAAGGARVGSLVVGNNLELRVPAPVGRTTRRAWVLFPLSKDAYEEAVKKYADFPTTDLPAEVRRNAVREGEPLTIGPDSPARWVEVPPDLNAPGVLYRRVPLKDLSALADKYPEVLQLTMYEFEHPTRTTPTGQPVREAILVKDDKDRDVSARGEPIPNWSAELRRSK